MSHVYNQHYVHLIWRTKKNRRILEGELEQFAHRGIREALTNLRLGVLAINSAWNHVHVLVKWNTTCATGDAVREAKSRTSRAWNDAQRGVAGCVQPLLYWQTGFGVVAVRYSEIQTVIDYIDNQKIHHYRGQLLPVLETTQPDD